ncbi:hypothetical protein NDU88_005160 [Pleurodeles waltl]|uniref:Uncharacterized protein n=1 Tax=Pleurodeles waltl TaxID=8319 RepID=A0AAV7UIR6_PLEWA|nr:hypothetical protein NDU88_005160 [Pleurodeles waltl]
MPEVLTSVFCPSYVRYGRRQGREERSGCDMLYRENGTLLFPRVSPSPRHLWVRASPGAAPPPPLEQFRGEGQCCQRRGENSKAAVLERC